MNSYSIQYTVYSIPLNDTNALLIQIHRHDIAEHGAEFSILVRIHKYTTEESHQRGIRVRNCSVRAYAACAAAFAWEGVDAVALCFLSVPGREYCGGAE